MNIIPDSYFADIVPTQPEEDQIMKRIESIVKHSKSKSSQEILQDAKKKFQEIKRLNQEIEVFKKQLETLKPNTVKRAKDIHEKLQIYFKREKLLFRISDLEYSLEKS